MSFQNKYLKYKNKYLDLKNQFVSKGGASGGASDNISDPRIKQLRYSISSALGYGTILDHLDDLDFMLFISRKLNMDNELEQVDDNLQMQLQFIFDNIYVQKDRSKPTLSSYNRINTVPESKSTATDNYLISLLWYNKELGPIQQKSPSGKDLHIKENLLKTYNMFKKKYNNPNVILFLNFDKIVEDDFNFFRRNNVVIEDVNDFNVIKNTPHLQKLFNPTTYNIEPCPVYIYVDMLKILIQYEQMVYGNYDYVIFSDIDIQDNINRDTIQYNEDIICKSPTLITTFRQHDLLDPSTIELLDIFGYLMAGFVNMTDITPSQMNYYNRSYDENNPGNAKNVIKIGNTLKISGLSAPENSFLISKKSGLKTIKAIKEYFIDYLFRRIYNERDNKTSRTKMNDFIYHSYIDFYYYLNLMNDIIIDQNKPDNQLIDIDDVLGTHAFVLTDKGKSILIKFNTLEHKNIFPTMMYYNDKLASPVMPFKCVPIGQQKNSL
jgi:hypothetical protein